MRLFGYPVFFQSIQKTYAHLSERVYTAAQEINPKQAKKYANTWNLCEILCTGKTTLLFQMIGELPIEQTAYIKVQSTDNMAHLTKDLKQQCSPMCSAWWGWSLFFPELTPLALPWQTEMNSMTEV